MCLCLRHCGMECTTYGTLHRTVSNRGSRAGEPLPTTEVISVVLEKVGDVDFKSKPTDSRCAPNGGPALAWPPGTGTIAGPSSTSKGVRCPQSSSPHHASRTLSPSGMTSTHKNLWDGWPLCQIEQSPGRACRPLPPLLVIDGLQSGIRRKRRKRKR